MLDDLDKLLIGALHLAPSASWEELSAVIGVNASTVSRRYNRLVERNVLRVVGEVEWGLYSTTLPVHLRIGTQGVPPSEVLQRLEDIQEVQYLALTYGTFPVFATIHAPSEPATAELLHRIYDIPGVSTMTTLPVLSFTSKGSGWDPQLLSPDQRTRCLKLVENGEYVSPRWPRDMPSPADEVEKRALELLQQDGRLASARLSKSLDVVPSTALRMVRKFVRDGWFRPRVEIDGAYLGYGAPFVLRVKAELDSVQDVSARLSHHPSTRFVTQVASEHNILCTGVALDRPHLAELINREFGVMPGVRDLDVDLFLVEVKRYWMSRGQEQRLGTFRPPSLL